MHSGQAEELAFCDRERWDMSDTQDMTVVISWAYFSGQFCIESKVWRVGQRMTGCDPFLKTKRKQNVSFDLRHRAGRDSDWKLGLSWVRDWTFPTK